MSHSSPIFDSPQSFLEAFPHLKPASRRGTLCFTNGCFDLIHAGHVQYLEDARALGDFLVVGLNSDQSVARIKGASRPLQVETGRALVLLGLRSVDAVVLFNEDTPAELIRHIQPDILVKGGDYTPETIVGRETVEKRSGRTVIIPFLTGYSTSAIVERIHSGRGVAFGILPSNN